MRRPHSMATATRSKAIPAQIIEDPDCLILITKPHARLAFQVGSLYTKARKVTHAVRDMPAEDVVWLYSRACVNN